MKVNLDSNTDDGQIQILPLIDVIFCILTFFIIAVLQMKQPQAVNVDLPQAKTGTVQAPDRLIITLMSGGQISVGQELVADRTALIDRAKTYITQRPDGLLVLNASQNAIYSEVIGILDALREVGGARRVALATNPKDDTSAPTAPSFPSSYSNPSSFPNSNPSGLPNSSLPGSNPSILPGSNFPGSSNPLFPDKFPGNGLNNPTGSNNQGANPTIPGMTGNTSPTSGSNSGTLPNSTSPNNTGTGPQDFNTTKQTIQIPNNPNPQSSPATPR